MNLIEELGIKKCKAIVDGAPEGANEYSVWASLSYYKTVGERCELWKQHYKWWTPVLYNSYMKQHRRSLDDLRTAIDYYYYGQSEAEELKQYVFLSQEKIDGGAILVGDFIAIQEQLRTELNNCSKKDSSEISLADCCTDNPSHFTDTCTDIRNHISPTTKVIEG